MAIPAIPEFEHFLSSISLDMANAHLDQKFFNVVDPTVQFDGTRYTIKEAIRAAYLPSVMTFDAAVARLGKEVSKSGHFSNDRIIRLLLGMSAASRPFGTSATDHFNNLLGKVSECDCSSFLISNLEIQQPTRRKVGSFHLGQIDQQKLRYRCKKVGCDFFDRDPSAFRNRYGIEREPTKVYTIDLAAIPSPRAEGRISSAMQDEYFSCLSLELFDSFVREFEEKTLLATAIGAPLCDLRSMLAMRGSFISIFQNGGSHGFGHIRPIGAESLIVFHPPEIEVLRIQSKLQQQFSFFDFNDSDIHQSLKSFSKLVVGARQRRAAGAIEDAFLHCVIALESIFGDRDAIARSLAKRLAIVVSGRLGKTVGETFDLITEIYDSRSRFVHSGIRVPERFLEAIWPIVGATFETLLEFQAKSRDGDYVSIESWLKKLDHLHASLAADERPADDKFIENGLLPPPA
jgi:hypothetical protein